MITRQHALGLIAGATAAGALPAVARADTMQSLSVGQIGNSVAFFPNFVAQNQGFFKAAGLNVTITPFASGTLVGTAVTSNSVDIGTSVITDVFSLLKADRPVKLVGSLCNGYYVDITASNQFLDATKLSRSSPLDAKIKALKGKKIGINGPGSGTEALVTFLLRSQNIDPERDVELVNIGADQGSILTTLKTGRIDCVSFAWPLSMLAQTNNIGKPFIMPAEGDVPAMRGQIQGVIYAKPDMIEKRPDAVIAFVHAIARAETFLHRNPAATRALLKQYDSALSDPAIDLLLAAYVPVLPQQADIAVDSYNKALQFHRLTGFAGPTGNAYEDVVDTAILQKAMHAK